MRRSAVLLLFSLLLLAVTLGVASAAAPVIDQILLYRGPIVGPEGAEAGVSYGEWMHMLVSDADGWDDVVSATIVDTWGTEWVLYAADPPPGQWAQEDADTVWIAWYGSGTSEEPPPGPYAITVSDEEGEVSTVTPDAEPILDIYPVLEEPLPNHSLVYTTKPYFKWSESLEGANHWIQVWNETVSEFGDFDFVWANRDLGSATERLYGDGGEVVEATLTPGHTYGWLITPWRLDYSGPTDTGVPIDMYTVPHVAGTFTVYSPDPVIDRVEIRRGGQYWYWWVDGRPTYFEAVWVTVTDYDGVGDIANVIVSDYRGEEYLLGHEDIVDQPSLFTATYLMWEQQLPAVAGEGPYSVTVVDLEGHVATMDQYDGLWAPPVIGSAPDLISPVPPERAVIDEVLPVFVWEADPASDGEYLGVWDNAPSGGGWDCWPAQSGVQYNADGTADPPELIPGHSYAWVVNSGYLQSESADSRVAIFSSWETIGSLWVERPLGEAPVPIQGQLLVWGDTLYYMEGMSDNVIPAPAEWNGGIPSPRGDRVVYYVNPSSDPEWYPWAPADLWLCNVDGSDAANLTGGIGGVNCVPQWSPDGSAIAFRHADPVEGQLACEAGFHVYLVEDDGSPSPLRLTPEGYPSTWNNAWMANGYRIIANTYPDGQTILIDTDGTIEEGDPPPGWGPNGADEVYSTGPYPEGVNELGEPGWWTQLVVRIRNTPYRNVVFQRFIRKEDVLHHLEHYPPEPWQSDPVGDVVWHLGPKNPVWSPRGDQIAFLAAMPFDPDGPHYREQVDVYVLDVETLQCTRVTADDQAAYDLLWTGNNTLPAGPGVPVSFKVDNTTVTFAEIPEGGDGLTTIIRDDDPPGPVPGGFTFLGEYYDISTTATLSPGTIITIQMHYDDADVPGGYEEWLCLLHFDTTANRWVDVTTDINTVDNIITGQVTSLSPFAVAAFTAQLEGLLPPVNNDGSSIFKLGRTVPVKFRLRDPDGSFITDAVAKLYVAKVTDQVVGTYEEPESTSAADTGNTFRYDAEDDQYIFNLGTKGLSTGTWALQVTVNGMVAKVVWISLK